MNTLTTLREDVATTLTNAGIKTVHYQETRITPPCAMVVPDDNYVTYREGDRFGFINVALQVVLLSARATNKGTAEAFDELILKALRALGDDFDVINVQSPMEVVVNEADHFAVIIQLEVQIHLGKENDSNG